MTITSARPPENLMRLGTHLEKHFFDETNLYDGIVVNANVVEAFPAAIAALLARFQKPFVIDPITYGFAMPPINMMRTVVDPKIGARRYEPKKTFLKLARRYADVFFQRLSAISPSLLSDLEGNELRQELCRNVIEFQENRLMESIKGTEDEEYLIYGRGEIRPAILLAPYFFMQRLDDGWFDLNLKLTEASARLDKRHPLYAMICVDPVIFDDKEQVETLGSAYANLGCAGYFIWLNNFAEHRASRTTLVRLLHFLDILKGKPIYNAYGGYLSQLLAFHGVRGTCHGPGYGEFRDVLPVGGGVPTAQYYVRPLRRRLVYADALVVIPTSPSEFFYRICNCTVCKTIIDDDISRFDKFGESETRESETGKTYTISTPESIRNCTLHYLRVKHEEFSEIQSALQEGSATTLACSLREDADWLTSKWGSFGVSHLVLWTEMLEGRLREPR